MWSEMPQVLLNKPSIKKFAKKSLMNNNSNRFSNLDFHIISNHKVSNWWLNLMMASVKNLAAQKLEENSCPCQSHWVFCFWNPNTSLAWMMGRRVGMLTLCNYWSTYTCSVLWCWLVSSMPFWFPFHLPVLFYNDYFNQVNYF